MTRSVFKDIGFDDSIECAKCEVTRQLHTRIKRLKLNSTTAAEFSGLKESDIQKIIEGKPTKLPLNKLRQSAIALGCKL